MMYVWKEGERGFYISSYLMQNLDNYVKGVMTKKTSAVFIFDGRSGLGKTTLSSQVGCYIAGEVAKYKSKKQKKKVKPKFSLDDMSWTPDDFIDKLKKAQPGDIVILDESMILSNRSALSEVNRMIVIMLSMIRSKQIFVIFNINSIFDMERNLPLHRADMLLHLYAVDEKFASRGRYFVVPSSRGRMKSLYINGKKFYDYSKAYPAFRDKFSSYFPFSDATYEKRKSQAIDSYFEAKGTTKDNKAKITLLKAVNYLFELTDDKQAVADKLGLHTRTVYKYLQEYKEKELGQT